MFIHALLVEEVIPMEKKDNLTKGLAMIGTILAWLPILAPIVLSGIFFPGRAGISFRLFDAG
jgi:hypothetical protein